MQEDSVKEFVKLCLVKNKNPFHRVITTQALYLMYFYFIMGDYKKCHDRNSVVDYKKFLQIIKSLLKGNIILYKGETSNFVIYDYMCRFDFMRKRNNLCFDFNFPTDIYRATSRLQNLDGIYITLPLDPEKNKKRKIEEYFDHQGESSYTTELKNNYFLSYEEVASTYGTKIPRPLTSSISYKRAKIKKDDIIT